MSAQPSQESAALTSAWSGPVCACCGRQRPMSGAGECCDGIGPTPTSTTTCEAFHENQSGELPSQGNMTAALKANASHNYQLISMPMAYDAYNQQEASVTHSLRKALGDGIPLTFSAVDSPAKTSPSPESDADSQESGQDSSLSSPGSQMSFDQLGSSLKTSLGSSPLPTDETWESFSQRWPKSGMASAGEWSTLDTSEFPSGAVECSLSDVLETTVPQRYALSARAAKGILSRANARGKTLPAELQQALTDLAEAA